MKKLKNEKIKKLIQLPVFRTQCASRILGIPLDITLTNYAVSVLRCVPEYRLDCPPVAYPSFRNISYHYILKITYLVYMKALLLNSLHDSLILGKTQIKIPRRY